MRKRIEMKFEGEFEILGHKVRLENIKNPHLRRAIQERAETFLFNYGDHIDHSEYKDVCYSYSDYEEWFRERWVKKDYTDHEDHKHSDYYYRVWGEYHAP